jgi:hypothetical protein
MITPGAARMSSRGSPTTTTRLAARPGRIAPIRPVPGTRAAALVVSLASAAERGTEFVWREQWRDEKQGVHPLIPIGRMVLGRDPPDYLADVEQTAFSPGNLAPEIAAPPGTVLQGRPLKYHDTHRHRVGRATT